MTLYDANLNSAIYAVHEGATVGWPNWLGQVDDPQSEQEESILGSQVLRQAVLSKIWDIARRAADDGWDGPGTFAIRSDAYARAITLVSALPVELLLDADISVTPSGSLSFDWETGSKNQLAIMLTANDTISYAAYRPEGRVHGAFSNGCRSLPEEIALAIRHWRESASRSLQNS